MKLLLLYIILFAAACKGQSGKLPVSAIDTAALFDPFPDSTGAIDAGMFRNAVNLFSDNYFVLQGDEQFVFNHPQSLDSFFSARAISIKARKFYIFTDSLTSFPRITAVIERLKKSRINNYRVLNYKEYFGTPAPPAIRMPVSTSTHSSDTASFLIRISKDEMQAVLNSDTTNLKDKDALGAFLHVHKTTITGKEIRVLASGDITDQQGKGVIDMLIKNGFGNFKFVTTEVWVK